MKIQIGNWFLIPFMKERETLSSFDAQSDIEKNNFNFKKKYILFSKINQSFWYHHEKYSFVWKNYYTWYTHWHRLENYVNPNQQNHNHKKTTKNHRNSKTTLMKYVIEWKRKKNLSKLKKHMEIMWLVFQNISLATKQLFLSPEFG